MTEIDYSSASPIFSWDSPSGDTDHHPVMQVFQHDDGRLIVVVSDGYSWGQIELPADVAASLVVDLKRTARSASRRRAEEYHGPLPPDRSAPATDGDAEIDAVRAMLPLIERLEPPSRGRVLRYLTSRLGDTPY